MSIALEAAILAAINTLAARPLRQREVTFTTSGTFVPADYGIPAGAAVRVLVVGAGAGGRWASTSSYNGGNAGAVVDLCVTISDPATPIPVVVGVGGAGSAGSNLPGGDSSFGVVVALGGKPDAGSDGSIQGGDGAGSMRRGQSGGLPLNGFARGGETGRILAVRANMGDGGDAMNSAQTTAGSNGRVQVMWMEFAP